VSTSAHVRGVDGLKWRRTAVGGCASSLHCAWYSPTDIASVVSSLSDVGLESLSPMLLSHASGADASGAISEGWLALRAGAGTAPASSLLKQRFAFAPCLLVRISRGVDTGDQTAYTTSWAPPFFLLLLTSGLSAVWDTGAIAIWRSLTTEPSIIPLYCGIHRSGRGAQRCPHRPRPRMSKIENRCSHQPSARTSHHQSSRAIRAGLAPDADRPRADGWRLPRPLTLLADAPRPELP
jgi:hypothetical protein